MKFFNKITLLFIAGSFMIISCHKSHETPTPVSSPSTSGLPSASGCYLVDESINGIKADSFSYYSNGKDSVIIIYDSTGKVSSTVSLLYNSNSSFSKISFSKTIGSGYITFKYDSENRPIGQYTYINLLGAQKIDSVNFTYAGSSSNIVKETNYTISNVILGTSNSVSVSYYTYDGNGNVLTETDSSSGALTDVYTYTYDSHAAPAGVALSNAISEFNSSNKYPDIAYLNTKNNVLSMTHKNGSGSQMSDSYTATYTYDSNGNPITEAMVIGGKTYNSTYKYICK